KDFEDPSTILGDLEGTDTPSIATGPAPGGGTSVWVAAGARVWGSEVSNTGQLTGSTATGTLPNWGEKADGLKGVRTISAGVKGVTGSTRAGKFRRHRSLGTPTELALKPSSLSPRRACR